MRRGCSFALFALMFATNLYGQAKPKESLLVLSKHDHTLAIVDPVTLKVVAKAPVGDDPHEVIATTDGKVAYVSNYGGGGAGALHTLAVIDLVGQKALAPIDLGALKGPHGLDFAGGKVWFTAEAAKVFGSVDPANGTSGFRFGQRTEPHAHGFCVAGFEQDFYVEHSVGDGEYLGESATGLAVRTATGRAACRRTTRASPRSIST